MANCCFTQVRISSTDKIRFKEFEEALEKWESTVHPVMEKLVSEHANKHLANFACWAGVTDNPWEDKSLRLRGWVDEIDSDEKEVTISQTDKWSPNVNVWWQICEKWFGEGNFDLLYEAQEPGCEIYFTNDPEQIEKYYFDSWDEENPLLKELGHDGYAVPVDKVTAALKKVLNIASDSIDILMGEFESSDLREKCALHRWEYFFPCDC